MHSTQNKFLQKGRQRIALVPIYLLLTVMFCPPQVARSQHTPQQYDSAYFERYPEHITARLYFSQKYTGLNIPGIDRSMELQYRANTKLNFGAGFTYHNFSVNFSYGFGFLNPDIEKGKTRSFDFQLHPYPENYSIDIYFMLYKGLYLDPKGYIPASNLLPYYFREDIRQNIFGLSMYRLTNAKRFSYRAAMIQNEWQKRSAGSFLFGGSALYALSKGDSALIPSEELSLFPQDGMKKLSLFKIGPGIGYAYTLVVKKHFFLTASLIANLDVSFVSEDGLEGGKENNTSVNPSATYKSAIGYNSDTWNVSANLAGNASRFKGTASDNPYFMEAGNYRFIVAKKIPAGPRLKKLLPF